MTEKKARSAFVPILAVVMLGLAAMVLLTLVPLKKCEGPHTPNKSPDTLEHEYCWKCQGTGKVLVWDLC